MFGQETIGVAGPLAAAAAAAAGLNAGGQQKVTPGAVSE